MSDAIFLHRSLLRSDVGLFWYVQLVLEILTQNVSRGSPVYEEGHILLLAWACTQRDREVIWKCLSQVRQPLHACPYSA